MFEIYERTKITVKSSQNKVRPPLAEVSIALLQIELWHPKMWVNHILMTYLCSRFGTIFV